MARRAWIALAMVAASSVAQCHDWSRFDREYSGAGTVSGDFRCPLPYALMGVWGANRPPVIARVSLADPPEPCEDLPLTGFSTDDAIRAIAVDGHRVLAAGDAGACIIEQGETSIRETCVRYANTTAAATVDAFIRVEPAGRRFAIAQHNGSTTRSITTILVEDEAHTFSRSLTLREFALPMLTAGGELLSLASSPDPSARLYAARAATEQLVSTTQEGAERAALIAIDTSDAPTYESVGVGLSNSNGPSVGLTRADDPTRIDVFANGTRRSNLFCGDCARVKHAIPVNISPLQVVIACDQDGTGVARAMLRQENGSCVQGTSWSAGRRLSRMAIRWQ